jgi:hypothetical protein
MCLALLVLSQVSRLRGWETLMVRLVRSGWAASSLMLLQLTSWGRFLRPSEGRGGYERKCMAGRVLSLLALPRV